MHGAACRRKRHAETKQPCLARHEIPDGRPRPTRLQHERASFPAPGGTAGTRQCTPCAPPRRMLRPPPLRLCHAPFAAAAMPSRSRTPALLAASLPQHLTIASMDSRSPRQRPRAAFRSTAGMSRALERVGSMPLFDAGLGRVLWYGRSMSWSMGQCLGLSVTGGTCRCVAVAVMSASASHTL